MQTIFIFVIKHENINTKGIEQCYGIRSFFKIGVELIEGNKGFYFYLYSFQDLIQGSFYVSFLCPSTKEVLQPKLWVHDQGKGVARVRAKRKPNSHITYSWDCRKVWGSELSHSQGNSHFGRWGHGGPPKTSESDSGVKTQWFMTFLYHWKALRT